MRFHLGSDTRAKSLARDLHHYLPGAKLSALQGLAARVYGYASWHELQQLAGKHAPSAWDEEVSPQELDARWQHQGAALLQFLGSEYEGAIDALLTRVRPTSKSPPERIERADLSSVRGAPALAVVQSPIFAWSIPGILFDSTDAKGKKLELSQAEIDAVVVPPEAQLALSGPQGFAQSTWLRDGDAVVQRCRNARLQFVDRKFHFAAVWRWEARAVAGDAEPMVTCTVEGLWARPGARPALQLLGRNAEEVRWHLMLAKWSPELAREVQERSEREAAMSDRELMARLARGEHTERDARLPKPMQVVFPESDLSLVAAYSVAAQFIQDVGGVFNADSDITFQIGAFSMGLGPDFGQVLDVGKREGTRPLETASRAVLVGNPAERHSWRIKVQEKGSAMMMNAAFVLGA